MKKAFDQTVRDLKREVNKKVLKVPGIEQKILDATSNESWGPHGSLLADIARATWNFNEYQLVMSVIWKRINDTGKNWRHVYKALTVLEYLVTHGSERVIDEIREHAYQISTLADFQYTDSSGKDQGSNVRNISQSLVTLVNDKGQMEESREKASFNQEKHTANRLSERNIDVPPSYEEATKDEDILKERDGEVSEMSPPPVAASTELTFSQNRNQVQGPGVVGSLRPSQNKEIFSPVSPHGASSIEVDLFGSCVEGSMSPMPCMPVTATPDLESDLPPILGFGDNFTDLSFGSSAFLTSDKPSQDPFGGSPFKAILQESTSEQLSETTPMMGTRLGQDFENPDPRKFGYTLSDAPNEQPGSANPEILPQGLSITKPVNDILGELFAPIDSSTALLSDSLTSKEASPNPFIQSGLPSQEAPLNPFIQSGLSSQGAPQKTFGQLGPSSQGAPQNPFGHLGPSSQETPPNPFAHPKLSSPEAPPNPFTLSDISLSLHEVPANPHAQSGLSTEESLAYQSIQSGLQGIPPSYISQTNPNLTPSGLLVPAVSQGFPPNFTQSSQTTGNLIQPGPMASLVSQGFPSNHVVQSPQTTGNLIQPGPMASLVSQGFPSNHVVQSPQTAPNLPQSVLPAPLSSQGLPPSNVAESVQATQATPRTSQGTSPIAPPTKSLQSKDKFEPKSSVWADTLSRGLVNLDISGAKINPLADIGIDFDSINRKEKRKEEKTTVPVSTITMGKAMGSGSGMGRVPPHNPMFVTGTGMSIGVAGVGGYGGGLNQLMVMGLGTGNGMGMGTNMSAGMGQGTVMQPGFGMTAGPGVPPGPGMTGALYVGTSGHGSQQPSGGGGCS